MGVCPDLRTPIDGDTFDAAPWWSTSQPIADYPERLSAVLPAVTSRHPDTRQWGSAAATTVFVSYTKGRVDELWARLDLRDRIAPALDALVTLGLDSDAWWVGGDATRRLPVGQTRDELLSAIKESDAARFVVDPDGFIAALAELRTRPSS